jgi:2-keto-4-pentenoate hydratase
MNTAARIAQAADLLVGLRSGASRPADLPESLRPATADEAYAIQDAILARLNASVGGWKVGAKAPGAEPSYAPMLASLITTSPASLSGNAFRERAVEAEIAVRFGRAVPPREAPYTRDEVLDAIDALLPGLEVLETRFVERTTVPPLSQLADLLSNGAYVAGPALTAWCAIEPQRQPVRLIVDGQVRFAGEGGNPAGDPFALVVWLAETLSRRGIGLAAGTIVTTGSLTGQIPVGPAAEVAAEMTGLGRVELRLKSN